jgi:hypothetical protein
MTNLTQEIREFEKRGTKLNPSEATPLMIR